MAEKWTKTSSPDWRWMNPKPLLALNHFTVPCSLTDVLPLLLSYLCFSTASSRNAKEAASVNLQPLQSNLKVLQEQQTHARRSTLSPLLLMNSFCALFVPAVSTLCDAVRTRAAIAGFANISV